MKEKNNLDYRLDNDLYDLNKLYKSIIRNKKIIGYFTGVSILISGIFAFSQKLIWQGEFQIVLSESDAKNSSNLAQSLLMNSSLFQGNLNFNNKALKTDIEILKSPSVLMPVYNFVKSNKRFN